LLLYAVPPWSEGAGREMLGEADGCGDCDGGGFEIDGGGDCEGDGFEVDGGVLGLGNCCFIKVNFSWRKNGRPL